MRWRARVVAPVLAGVLGVTGGVGVALAGQQTGSTTRTFDDPLGLRVPLTDLPCDSDEAILIVGHGDGRAALDSGVANNQGVRYLETADSCPTQYAAENAAGTPKYVAYLGPYTDLRTACTLRLTKDHARDYVARLKQGNTELVKCPCVVRLDQFPTLDVQDTPTAYDNVWARSLQGMLHDEDPKDFTRKDITGTYDEFTRRYILQRFQTPAGYLNRNGVLDPTTWGIVTSRICPSYTY